MSIDKYRSIFSHQTEVVVPKAKLGENCERMSIDKYRSIFSHQTEVVVFIIHQIFVCHLQGFENWAIQSTLSKKDTIGTCLSCPS